MIKFKFLTGENTLYADHKTAIECEFEAVGYEDSFKFRINNLYNGIPRSPNFNYSNDRSLYQRIFSNNLTEPFNLYQGVEVQRTKFNSFNRIKFDLYKELFNVKVITYKSFFNTLYKYMPLFVSLHIKQQNDLILQRQFPEFVEVVTLALTLGSIILSQTYSNEARDFTEAQRKEFEANCEFILNIYAEAFCNGKLNANSNSNNYRHADFTNYSNKAEIQFLVNLEENHDTSLLAAILYSIKYNERTLFYDTNEYNQRVLVYLYTNRDVPLYSFELTKLYKKHKLGNFMDSKFEEQYFNVSKDTPEVVNLETPLVEDYINKLYGGEKLFKYEIFDPNEPQQEIVNNFEIEAIVDTVVKENPFNLPQPVFATA